MLSVEDWAEIRRLHRGEGMPIKVIARAVGDLEEHGEGKLAADAPPRYRRAAAGSAVDEVEPRIRRLLRQYSDDAGDGDRRAGRLDPGDDGVHRAGAGAAAGVFAAGPVVAHGVCGGGDRAERFLVPRYRVPGRVRADPHRQAAAGADDGVWVFADAVGRLLPTRTAQDLYAAGGSTFPRWVRCRGCWSGTVRARSVSTAAAATS